MDRKLTKIISIIFLFVLGFAPHADAAAKCTLEKRALAVAKRALGAATRVLNQKDAALNKQNKKIGSYQRKLDNFERRKGVIITQGEARYQRTKAHGEALEAKYESYRLRYVDQLAQIVLDCTADDTGGIFDGDINSCEAKIALLEQTISALEGKILATKAKYEALLKQIENINESKEEQINKLIDRQDALLQTAIEQLSGLESDVADAQAVVDEKTEVVNDREELLATCQIT